MTMDEFFAELCLAMGWQPTPWRIAVFNYWAGRESAGQLFTRARNPLATTYRGSDVKFDLGYNNGNGPGNWNSVPVKVYASYEDGIKATANTLKLSYYKNVRRCFEDQRGYQEAVGPSDFTSWIGPDVQYGQAVVDFMNQTTASKEALAVVSDDRSLKWQRWPLSWEWMDRITGPFAATSPNPPWTPARPHMGVDIGTWVGTPVFAPASGEIVAPYNDGSFGVAVCIQHDSDPTWYSLFAHLSRGLVSVGQVVKAGDLIAYTGDTPNVAPHLHWQVCRSNMFPRDLSMNRDPLLVPVAEEGEDAMTPEQVKMLDDAVNRILRLEQIVGGYGIDTDGDGVIDLTGEDAVAYAYQKQWSAFYGIGLARQKAAEVEQSIIEIEDMGDSVLIEDVIETIVEKLSK